MPNVTLVPDACESCGVPAIVANAVLDKNGKRPTARQAKFAKNIASSRFDSMTACAIDAGYSPISAASTASQLARNVNVQGEIARQVNKRADKAHALKRLGLERATSALLNPTLDDADVLTQVQVGGMAAKIGNELSAGEPEATIDQRDIDADLAKRTRSAARWARHAINAPRRTLQRLQRLQRSAAGVHKMIASSSVGDG